MFDLKGVNPCKHRSTHIHHRHKGNMTYFPRAVWCTTSPKPVTSIPACIHTNKVSTSSNFKYEKTNNNISKVLTHQKTP